MIEDGRIAIRLAKSTPPTPFTAGPSPEHRSQVGRERRRGRYPIRPWEQRGAGPQFEALFVAGAPDHPLGAFRGESGWVTITGAEPGRISGEFELEARGFVATAVDDEDQWVTVRGSFEARGDSTIGSMQAVSASLQ
jgi:hypothetical protein